jgi:tetratricopeptide (TPR) repeat protein
VIPGQVFRNSEEAARMELQRAQVVIKKRPEDALRHLSEGRRLDPENLEIALELARTEVLLARYSEAIDSLQRLLVLDSSCSEALGLSSLCHFKMRRFDVAEDMARGALASNGCDRLANEVLADCLRARGEWNLAINEINGLLETGVDLDEGQKARLNLKLAHCLLRIGSHSQAWDITRILLRNGYSGRQVQSIHHESEILNKAEISEAFGGEGLIQRVFLWIAGRHILRAFAIGKKRGQGFHGRTETESLERAKGGPYDHL